MSTAGDVNGDGVDDLLIGAPGASFSSGASYVVFGGAGVGSGGNLELSALDGTNGFTLSGVAVGDISGFAVSTAGDVNGDGVDDLLIGAPYAPYAEESGASYVVFGGAGVGNSGNLELSALNGTNGFKLSGVAAFDHSGYAVSTAGDVNGDGVDDLLIGAYGADPNGARSGASYVVFGQRTRPVPPVTCNGLPATVGCTVNGVPDQVCRGTSKRDIIIGTTGNDTTVGLGSNDFLQGSRGDDLLCGGEGNDRLIGGLGDDRVFGEAGDDDLRGRDGNDRIDGGEGNDRLKGHEGNDQLSGGDGDDALRGLEGNDTLDGGVGKDLLRGGPDADTLDGGPGPDKVNGGAGRNTCTTDSEDTIVVFCA